MLAMMEVEPPGVAVGITACLCHRLRMDWRGRYEGDTSNTEDQ